jgi:hypothetical protein
MKIIIFCHHKTGTVFWKKIFEKFSKTTNLKLITLTRSNNSEMFQEGNWDICLLTHSHIQLDYFKNLEYRGIHSIRNPANIIVSACKYHKKSKENWLHVKKFDGLSYQEKLLSLNDFQDQLIFEMSHSSYSTIKKMINIMKNNSFKIFNSDIEVLSYDKQMKDFKNLFYFLQIDKVKDFSMENWINIGKKEFLWNKNLESGNNLHITREKVNALLDYRDCFGEKAKNEFKNIFGLEIYNYTF